MRNIYVIFILLFVILFEYLRTGGIYSSFTQENIAIKQRLNEVEKSVKDHKDQLEDLSSRLVARSHPIQATDTFQVVICISTVRRNTREEYLYSTLNSLIPYMGTETERRVNLRVLVVDVERGEGEYAEQIRERHSNLVGAGKLVVKHLDEKSRSLLYKDLVNTCSLPRFYGDDLDRVIWRSKRVLDFVYSMDLAINMNSDYIYVLEDDTPIMGNIEDAMEQCHDMYGKQERVACRWDFWWREMEARRRLATSASRPPRVMYPQGDLQGVFAMMMRTSAWSDICKWSRQHFAKAPADWLIGRYLFQENWRIAFMSLMNVYHKPGPGVGGSSRMSISHSLKTDPLFKDQALSWNDCDENDLKMHPFKDKDKYQLHWVGGSEDLFLKVPFMDIIGYDVGVPRDAGFMDQGGHVIVCERTPKCIAVNKNGWMKHSIEDREALARPMRKQDLFVRVWKNGTNMDKVKEFYEFCMTQIPPNLLRAPKRAIIPRRL